MEDFNQAHKYCSNNKEELLKDQKCGCFYCLAIFYSKEIEEWVGINNDTALCPYCGIDSIIGESSEYPMTEDFLKEMNLYWF